MTETAATATLNGDFSRYVRIDTDSMDWQASPSPSVWRKRLDLVGPVEAGRVTSIVRYDADSAFPQHGHPDGEEILVLDGVFSDEHGVYPAGSYLLNPEGFRHAPRSAGGCVLFVKLRQYPGTHRKHIAIDTNRTEWQGGRFEGIETLPLFQEDGDPVFIRLARYAPGARFIAHDHPGGEELFILSGEMKDENGSYPAGTWVRYPPGSRHTPWSETGATLYVKSGHLA